MFDPKLEMLISAWLDGRISEADSQDLQGRLRESAEARKLFIRYSKLDAAFRRSAEGGGHLDSRKPLGLFPNTSSNHALWKSWATGSIAWGYIAFSIGLVCLCVGLAYELGKSRTATSAVTATAIDIGEENADVEQTISGYASLRRVAGIEWHEGARSYREGDVLPEGLLEFRAGVAEIDFFCGATLVVEGPAKLWLESDWSARLLSGRIRANVPPAAQGFVVKAADAEIIDLGTEFAMDVGPDHALVEVLDGEVKLRGGEHDGKHLTTGEKQSLSGDEPNIVSFRGLSTFRDVGRIRQAEQTKRFLQWKKHSETLRADDRLIAYYPIAESVERREIVNRSVAGADRNAAMVGTVGVVQGRFGDLSSAVGFERPGSRLRTRIEGEFEAFSFACWVRINSLDNVYNALFMADGYENGEPHWQIRKDGKMMFSVMVDDTPGAGMGKLPDARLHRIYYTDPIWDETQGGQWMHLAVTYDPIARKVHQYVNGKEVGRHIIKSRFYVNRLRIGASEIGNWGQPFRNSPSFAMRNLNGSIDEMAIFGCALQAEEIAGLYENGKPFGY